MFQLAVRTALARRAVIYQLPVGARFTHHTVLFLLPVGAGVARRADAFPLTVRAEVAHRTVVFHLAVGAGATLPAAAFQLAVRTGGALRAVVFTFSCEHRFRTLTAISRHHKRMGPAVVASSEESSLEYHSFRTKT